jgi:hypothetical protein
VNTPARLELPEWPEDERRWFILREPGCVPQLKGPFPPKMVKGFLRELMEHRPHAFVTVLSISYGQPVVEDGPECLEILDGRMAATARRHRQSTRKAFAAL